MKRFICFASLLVAMLSTTFAPLLMSQDDAIHKLRKAEMRRAASLKLGANDVLQSARRYDVAYYKLDLSFNKTDDRFGGNVTTLLKSVVASLDTIDMNLASNASVDSVTIDGRPAAFSHSDGVLSIYPTQPITLGSYASTCVYYTAAYAGSGVTRRQVQNVDLGVTTTSIASQSEAYDARTWWPCKDDCDDKADSTDLYYTIDSDLFPVGNGIMLSDVDNGDGTHTVHWTSHYPIVTYLVSIAAANYTHNTLSFDYGTSHMPMESWFYGLTKTQMAQFEQTALNGLKVYSDLFIPYPFMNEKYGMAEYEWGGSMEHQTVTSMGFYGDDVTVHELAHQWFGDKVTCASFEHIWLNEGWATYCEALYREATGGLAALKSKMATTAYYGSGKIWVDDPENGGFSRIFDGNLSYDKASWVVHMLRHIVGDSAFFRAVRKYLGDTSKPTYRSVTTDEFQNYLEAESGKNLDPFIQNWIYGEYYPTYKYSWSDSTITGGHLISLSIEQLYVPARQVFVMPIDINITFAASDTTIVVQNDQEIQNYQFVVRDAPKNLQLDKDNWILKRVVAGVTLDQGILLVNGVDWDVSAYTDDIKAAYADSTFTGTHPYTFWDIFPNPAAGYPDNIHPYGTGDIPSDEIGHYCTVVWIGNAYNGDEIVWNNANLMEYIKQGGNVILITRNGTQFISGEMKAFLGINWSGERPALQECRAIRSDLVDMTFTGEQNLVVASLPPLTRTENEVLFTDNIVYNPACAIGIRALPQVFESGMSGQMVYLALRPYRVEHTGLKQNMQVFLDAISCSGPSDVEAAPIQRGISLGQNYPNPVVTGSTTIIPVTLDASCGGTIALHVYNSLGQRIRTQVIEHVKAGETNIALPVGSLPAGVYSYEVTAGTQKTKRTMVVVR
jgi:hypothetical protein